MSPERSSSRRVSLALLVALAVVAVTLLPSTAVASGAAWRRRSAGRARGQRMALAQAPQTLQEAVRATVDLPSRGATPALRQTKLAASDGAAGDSFGWSVSISGSTAVVGAPGSNGDTGSAYVFVRSGPAWNQQAELRASDGISGDFFGWSVAVTGSTAVVGANGKKNFQGAAYVFGRSGTAWVGADGRDSFTGAAYVFVQSGTTWTQQAELTASDGLSNDLFGGSVAISGPIAVVGADGTDSFTGAAYVFVQSGTTWFQRAKISAFDGAPNDLFGDSVAISGPTVMVGARGRNGGAGAAYVFVLSGTAWNQEMELGASDGASNDHFGRSVGISGSTAVAGAPDQNASTGAAYVFALPHQQAELTVANGGDFGSSVAISGSTAGVGIPGQDSATGAAYVYVRSGTSWTLQARLRDSNPATADWFASSVAISGDIVVAGAPYKYLTGAAYVFVRTGSTWAQQAELRATDAAMNDSFGMSAAISGTTVLVGAYAKDSGTGAAYVFVQSGSTWTQQAKLAASDGEPNEDFGWRLDLSGSTAAIGAYEKDGFVGAAYVFVRTGSTWTQQAELVGTGQGQFGQDVAVSGSTLVVGAPFSGPAGTAFVYVRSGSTWTQQAALTAPDAVFGDGFAFSVALDGSTALVGAPDSEVGVAYAFARTGTTWSEEAELSPLADGSDFGDALALDGSIGVVGSPLTRHESGAAYVFADL